MGKACSKHGEKLIAYSVLMEKPNGYRPLGGPRRRWKDNSKMDLRKTEWGGMDCINLAQDKDQWQALVNTTKNLRVPKNFRKLSS
jgi:hypothetical protein